MAITKPAFVRGIILPADDVALEGIEGELKASATSPKLKTYINGATRNIVTDTGTETLTNKTYDAAGTGNVLSNVATTNLASGVLNISTSMAGATDAQVPSALAIKTYADNTSGAVDSKVNNLITLSGVPANSTNLGTFTGTTIPDNQNDKQALQALETAVETKASSTLTSAHIYVGNGSNVATDVAVTGDITITNAGVVAIATGVIVDADINASAAIDAAKIANGSVSSTEFQYLDGVTSAIQTQIDTKVAGAAASVDSEIMLYSSTTGKVSKRATGTGVVHATSGVYSVSNVVLTSEVTGVLPLANGGSNKNMTAVAGGVVWTDADSMEVTAAGSSGQFLISNGTSAPSWSSVSPGALQIATISDVKTANTSGGTFTSGSFVTRTLNTLSDPASIVTSLTSNQFVLAAGTYYFDISAPAMLVSNHKAKLRNITDSTDALIGTSSYADVSGAGFSFSLMDGSVTIAAPKTFEVQHRCAVTRSTDGFGQASNFGVSEVYTIVKITKVS